MKNKKGISLIVLVITILVMVILAGVVVVTMQDNNPIQKAQEANFVTDAKTFAENLNMCFANMQLENSNFKKSTVNAKTYVEVKKYITSFTEKYNGKYEIKNGNLVYTGVDKKEAIWAESAGIPAVNAIYTEEEIAKYIVVQDALNKYASGKDRANINAKTKEELTAVLGGAVAGLENKVEVYKGELYKTNITYADVILAERGIGLKLNMDTSAAYKYMTYDAVENVADVTLLAQALESGIKDVWPTYYGPYIKLKQGNYVANITGSNVDKLDILAYYNGGVTDACKYAITRTTNTLTNVTMNIAVTNNPVNFELIFCNKTFLEAEKTDITINKDIYLIKK